MSHEKTHQVTQYTCLAEFDSTDPSAEGTNPLSAVLLVSNRAATIVPAPQGPQNTLFGSDNLSSRNHPSQFPSGNPICRFHIRAERLCYQNRLLACGCTRVL